MEIVRNEIENTERKKIRYIDGNPRNRDNTESITKRKKGKMQIKQRHIATIQSDF